MKKIFNKKIKLIFFVLFFAMFLNVFEQPSYTHAQTMTEERKQALESFNNSGQQLSNPSVPASRPAPQSTSTTAGNRYYQERGMGGLPDEDNVFSTAIKWLLLKLREFLILLVSVAATLFEFIVDPRSMSGDVGILNSAAVEEVWVMVRDFLNMFFILVLLFSAFSTIFQVDKYSIKKIWLNLLINALLVNFSFPIARFIIDISNVAMYYMLNNMFTGPVSGGSGIMTGFASVSHMNGIMNAQDHGGSLMYLIATIVFIFIFGMTLMVLAGLFLVRLVALTMLVMFSPIGFVGYIFPTTKSYADKWWDNLFKYAFFGPIMVLIMMVALKVMESVDTYNSALMASKGQAQGTTGSEGAWIADVAFYLIPITILWMGMSYAQSSGVAMAGTVVGKVKKGGDWLRGAMWNMTGGAAWKGSGIPGAYKKAQEDFSKNGKIFGKRVPLMGSKYREEREARMAGLATGWKKGYLNSKQNQDAAAVKEAAEKKDMGNMTEFDLHDIVNKPGGSEHDKAAARIELANRNAASVDDILAVKEKFGDNSKVYNQLRNKMKTYDPTAAFALSKDENTGEITFDTQRMKEHLDSNQFDSKKIGPASLGNAKFVQMAIDQGAMNAKDFKDLADKGKPYANSIKKSLDKVLNEKETDIDGNVIKDKNGNDIYHYSDLKNEKHRNAQIAFLTQTGEVHASLRDIYSADGKSILSDSAHLRKELFSRLNKDNAAKLSTETIDLYKDEIAKNIDKGKVGEILRAIPKEADRKTMVKHIWNNAPSLQKAIKRDPYLDGLRTS